jgi:hypothetical protein
LIRKKNGGVEMTEERIRDLAKEMNISSKEFFHIVRAVMKVYPMIVLANLTKNTYIMIRDDGFLCRDITSTGCYDDMIDDGVENIHPNYQNLFLKSFSKENLMQNYANGMTEVYAEVYQKDKNGKYHWVSVHAIPIEDESGDMIHICLNRILDTVSRNEYGQRK